MNTVILDVSEYINPVYQQYGIVDDGNLLHNCANTSMHTLFIIGASPEAKYAQLVNDLHGYVLGYTQPAHSVEVTVAIAKACADIVNRLIKQYALANTPRISVLNTTKTVSGYILRVGYY